MSLDVERRLERAKFHFDDLDVHVEEFRRRDPYTTVSEPDLKRGGYILKIASHEPVPPVLGLIAADFVHNLRALLDNLIWSVAPASLKRNQNLVFPLCSTRAAFDEFTKAVLKGLLPVECVDALERHQPYNRRPDDVENDRLLVLHKMWNADKHHAPMGVMFWALAAVATAFGDHPHASDFGFQVGPLSKGQEVGWVSNQGAQHDPSPSVHLDIGFKTRRPSLSVPRHALAKMHDIVANEVLPDFRQFV